MRKKFSSSGLVIARVEGARKALSTRQTTDTAELEELWRFSLPIEFRNQKHFKLSHSFFPWTMNENSMWINARCDTEWSAKRGDNQRNIELSSEIWLIPLRDALRRPQIKRRMRELFQWNFFSPRRRGDRMKPKKQPRVFIIVRFMHDDTPMLW